MFFLEYSINFQRILKYLLYITCIFLFSCRVYRPYPSVDSDEPPAYYTTTGQHHPYYPPPGDAAYPPTTGGTYPSPSTGIRVCLILLRPPWEVHEVHLHKLLNLVSFEQTHHKLMWMKEQMRLTCVQNELKGTISIHFRMLVMQLL